MKKTIKFLAGATAIFALFLFTGCEGPEGQDGDESCKECHSIENMSLKSAQYEVSQHGAGEFVDYAGGRLGCAACHSHEGFVETQRTGRDTTAANVPIPTRIDCETCHSGHKTFDSEKPDFALRTSATVALRLDKNLTIDLGNSSNLCVNCHQPRANAPKADDKGEFKITSSRFGPHHGPQGTLLQGVGAYEGSGAAAYPAKGSSTHVSGGACVTCHMGDKENAEGGHSFNPTVAACTECHTDAKSFDVNGVQTEVVALLDQLHTNLKAKGVIGADDKLVLATYPVSLAGAYFNYISVEEDRSKGVHNPAYIKALLKNSIDATK